jgi:translation elongation factor EF-4
LINNEDLQTIREELEDKLEIPSDDIFFISAATGQGTSNLIKSLETEVIKNRSILN